MATDDDFEVAIESLLDGRPLPDESSPSGRVSLDDPLRVVDAISRAHRTAIFGKDISPDRSQVTRWGHLEVRGEIGRGASGTVYRAWDERLARQVALKLLDSDAQPGEASLEEGRLLARLNHAHIVRVLGADSHDGVAGIWMEILEGVTLDEILSRDGVFGGDETLLIGLDLAGALRAVHSAGLLHRDIKGRNVLRERGGRIVLMDLGSGRATNNTPAGGDETGTPMYMAPEVLAGGPATARSDVYSLGVLLYRLLTARFPVAAANVVQLRSAHARGDRVPLRQLRNDLTSDITATIERACDPDPDVRYPIAAEFEDALADLFQRSAIQQQLVASALARTVARWKNIVVIATLTMAVALLTTWGAWDTNVGRDARRRFGLSVPPRSVLYLTLNGGLGIVRGGQFTLLAHNPTVATAIAVSWDLGVRTMAGMSPWTTGGSFRLDGSALVPSPTINDGLCCFSDGTTDGLFNYAARQDSTLLDPIGSRPLAPPALYRFERDWSNPRSLFPLEPDGFYYGVAYSRGSQSFWLTRKVPGGAVVEQWSGGGKRVATPINLPTAVLTGVAIDPRDETVWAVSPQYAVGIIRLENFDQSGRRLTSLDLPLPQPMLVYASGGAEFAWPQP